MATRTDSLRHVKDHLADVLPDRLSRLDFTASASCQARRRLPTAALDADPEARWKGHRVFLLDGSNFSMPDTEELREAFGSYAHLALLRGRSLHGLFRAHQRQIIDFRPRRRYAPPGAKGAAAKGLPRSRWLKRLGKHDQLVEYPKPKERPEWMSAAAYAALPETLVVRELRYDVRLPGRRTQRVTLGTTLLDARRYPAWALAKLYGLRWQAETDLSHLKGTLGLDVLRSQTVPGVVKELVALVIIDNLVRRVMHQAARRQGVAPARVSFIDAWRWLKHARPGNPLPVLKVNPERPGRAEPRVRKRRPKQFPLMTRPRAELRQALLIQNDAA